MFTTVPIHMSVSREGQQPKFDGVINVHHIVSVFPQTVGEQEMCSVMMMGSMKLTVALPFAEFSERLLELRSTPP